MSIVVLIIPLKLFLPILFMSLLAWVGMVIFIIFKPVIMIIFDQVRNYELVYLYIRLFNYAARFGPQQDLKRSVILIPILATKTVSNYFKKSMNDTIIINRFIIGWHPYHFLAIKAVFYQIPKWNLDIRILWVYNTFWYIRSITVFVCRSVLNLLRIVINFGLVG